MGDKYFRPTLSLIDNFVGYWNLGGKLFSLRNLTVFFPCILASNIDLEKC